MNREVNINNNKKRLKLYYGLLVTVLCIIGVSFAWFRLYLSQSENNTLSSRTCFNTTLTEDTSKIELTDAFPITDSEGLKQTPFTFTIKNNCDSYVQVYITIDSAYRTSTNASYLKDNYLKVNVSPKDTTNNNKSVILGKQSLTDLDNNSKGYVLVNTGLKANEEKSYDLRIWMDSSVTTEQGLNKSWAGKIVVVSNASKEPLTLAKAILVNNEVQTPLTIPGAEVSANKEESNVTRTDTKGLYDYEQECYVTYGTGWEANGAKFNLTGAAVATDTYANSYQSLVGKYLTSYYDFCSSTTGTMLNTTNLDYVVYVVSATSSSFTYKIIYSNKNTTEALLASTEDDYGTSYYFRGSVTNNYVEFANKCWRIVRIGGDNTVKLILHNDNTTNASNPCSSANNSTTAAFVHYDGDVYGSEFNASDKDNAYVGFMYGTPGSSTYEATHANTNKSTILTNLETWYNNNLKVYESEIADNVFCTDKNNVTDTSYDPFDWGANGLGYGTNNTYYGATQRLVSSSNTAGGTGPSLRCNGDLSKITSKIGLITADELAYAGYAYNLHNTGIYLQENANSPWWSLSPSDSLRGTTDVWRVDGASGELGIFFVGYEFGVRPYISLKASVKVSSGTGTSEDPYVIEA